MMENVCERCWRVGGVTRATDNKNETDKERRYAGREKALTVKRLMSTGMVQRCRSGRGSRGECGGAFHSEHNYLRRCFTTLPCTSVSL